MDNEPKDDLLKTLDKLCAERGVSRRHLSLASGMSDGAIKNIATGATRSPRLDSLARLAAAASKSFTVLIGDYALRAKIGRPHSSDNTLGSAPVTFSDHNAELVEDADELEWLQEWRDMEKSQRRRALNLIKAFLQSDGI